MALKGQIFRDDEDGSDSIEMIYTECLSGKEKLIIGAQLPNKYGDTDVEIKFISPKHTYLLIVTRDEFYNFVDKLNELVGQIEMEEDKNDCQRDC
ncbi:MAG: hypothetical protein ACOC80_13075 [Petrotogales bacterium]